MSSAANSPGAPRLRHTLSFRPTSSSSLNKNNKDNEEDPSNWRTFHFSQEDENDEARVIILHEPSLPNAMGSIHPNGSLYERPLDVTAARKEHQTFREELEKLGAKVFTVRDILLMECDTNIVARVALEDFAFSSIKYMLDPTTDHTDLTSVDRFYLSDEYKSQCIDKMNNEQLVEVILTNPTITLKKADKDTELLATDYTFHPLVNLVYCRDQQITTRKGIVMAALSSPIRAPETKVMRFCFQKLDLKIVGEVRSPGKLEGGDFFPAGKDLCLIGVGMRSNMRAVQQLFEEDLFGTRRVAVVKDYFDQDQQRMHLDTVFNIISPKVCLILESIMGLTPRMRLVDEYTQIGSKYYLTRSNIEFVEFLKQEGYSIIPVTEAHQFAYGCNGLNMGNGTLVNVDKNTAKHLARSHAFNGRIINIDFTNMTNMYGSVHCCSQVVSRKRRANPHDQEDQTSPAITPASTPAITPSSTPSSQRPPVTGEPVASVASNIPSTTSTQPASQTSTTASLQSAQAQAQVQVQVQVQEKGESTSKPDATESEARSALEFFRELPSSISHTRLWNSSTGKPAQSSNLLIMVTPANFYTNPFTEKTNIWMKESSKHAGELAGAKGRRNIIKLALEQYSNLYVKLREIGVKSFLYTHESYEQSPDSVFVNDWFSTHSAQETGGQSTFVLYPIWAPNRRSERRPEIIKLLKQHYQRCINLTSAEDGDVRASETYEEGEVYSIPRKYEFNPEGKYLEFGGVVLDRTNKIAFISSQSERTNIHVAELWASLMNYNLIPIRAHLEGKAVHHASAMMFLGTGYALLCSGCIDLDSQRATLVDTIKKTGREIIEITMEQMTRFGGEAKEVIANDGSLYLLMSTAAFNSYHVNQLSKIAKYAKVIHVDLSLIEKVGGGSINGCISSVF